MHDENHCSCICPQVRVTRTCSCRSGCSQSPTSVCTHSDGASAPARSQQNVCYAWTLGKWTCRTAPCAWRRQAEQALSKHTVPGGDLTTCQCAWAMPSSPSLEMLFIKAESFLHNWWYKLKCISMRGGILNKWGQASVSLVLTPP